MLTGCLYLPPGARPVSLVLGLLKFIEVMDPSNPNADKLKREQEAKYDLFPIYPTGNPPPHPHPASLTGLANFTKRPPCLLPMSSKSPVKPGRFKAASTIRPRVPAQASTTDCTATRKAISADLAVRGDQSTPTNAQKIEHLVR